MRSIKRLVLCGTLCLMVFALVACGGPKPSQDDNQADSNQDQKKLKVAIVLAGPANDNGWNATGYAGLQEIEKQLGAEVAFSDQVPVPEYEETFRDYASKGYDLIIGHGGEFSDAAEAVASEFPEVKFAVINGNKTAANLSTFGISDEQVAFLAGAVAGLTTKSNVVSGIGGMEIPPTFRSLEGFQAGVKYVNPDANVLLTYTGSFTDAAKGKEAAMSQIAMDSDVIFYYLDAASPGVIQAAQSEGAKCIATITDQYESAPDTMLTSALTDLSKLILHIGKQAQDGQLEGKDYSFGIEDNDIARLADFRGSVPAEVEEKIKQISDDIVSGKIIVEKVESRS